MVEVIIEVKSLCGLVTKLDESKEKLEEIEISWVVKCCVVVFKPVV